MDAGIERLEIDGIPTFAARTAPRYTGMLIFRTGRADEMLRNSGITHLVEHLAMFQFGPHQPFMANAMVGGLCTSFWATGRPDEVAGFLRNVATALHDLPLGRIQDESRVLRTEEAGHAGGPPTTLLWFRYGATGHGLAALPEIGLGALDRAMVRDWAAERFTAGNAALWFTGPPPEGLSLGLPPGPRIPPPQLAPVSGVPYPAWAPGGPGVIGVSFVRPRRDWLSIPLTIAAVRLSEQLRFRRGLTYDMAIGYEPITTDTSHAALWTQSLPEHGATVRDTVVEVLESLARDGATDEDLARVRNDMRRAREDPDAVANEGMIQAINELLGFPNHSAAEHLAEIDRLDGREVARRMTAALESALFLVPQDCPLAAQTYRPYPAWSASAVPGRSFRPAAARFPWSKGIRLVVGREGVSLVNPAQQAITVYYANCAAAVSHPTGALEIFGEDGFRVAVEPKYWRGGVDAVLALLAALPPGRLVPAPADTTAP